MQNPPKIKGLQLSLQSFHLSTEVSTALIPAIKALSHTQGMLCLPSLPVCNLLHTSPLSVLCHVSPWLHHVCLHLMQPLCYTCC